MQDQVIVTLTDLNIHKVCEFIWGGISSAFDTDNIVTTVSL